MNNRLVEDDDIPLCQYLYNNSNIIKSERLAIITQNFKPLLNINNQKRPSYPNTPSFLLDTFSDDEDDEDLVPIAVLQSPDPQRTQFQSAADKYKEKVKAQLNQQKSILPISNRVNDDEVPLSQACFYPTL